MKKRQDTQNATKSTTFSKIQNYFFVCNRILILVCTFIILSIDLTGQIIFHDTKERIGKEQMMAMFYEAKFIADSLKCLRDDHYSLDIIYRGSDLVMFVNGYFNVYLWKNNSWQQQNNPRKGGYNFGSKKFIWNNRIFSFGGYGYWNHHGDLIEFDFEKGDWQRVNLNETLPTGAIFITTNGFRLISNKHYDVNLNTNVVKKHPQNIPLKMNFDEVYYGTKIESAHWAYLVQGSSDILIQKQEDKIYYSNIRTLETFKNLFFIHNYLIQCKNDSLIRWSPDGVILKALNIREHVTNYKKIDLNTKKESIIDLFWYATLTLGLSIAIYFWNNFRNKLQMKSYTWQNPLISVLVGISATKLTTEQLDKLLDIEGVTPLENKKYKRSRILQEINKEYEIKVGKTLITRVKDPEDGRKFLYEINMS